MIYPEERKEAILKKLLPPASQSVAEVAKEAGVSEQTIYNWRKKANQPGAPLPRKTTMPDNWSAETKLAVVIETSPLSESELGQYCRKKGLYVEQVKQWKIQCLTGFKDSKEQQKEVSKKTRADQLKIKSLKKELRHKEKALAETAALLVLRKKLNAFWETSSGDD
jgi:transposase-like protein